MSQRVRQIQALAAALHGRRQAVAIAVYVGLNLGLILQGGPPGPHNDDWQLFLAMRSQDFYGITEPGPFNYSPIAGWALVAITYTGYWAWFALHYVAVWLVRFSPLLVLLILSSWALWVDAAQGNALVFSVVAGALALRGHRRWALAYVALLLLMPRPIQVPLGVWLMWRMPEIRWPAVGLAAVFAAISVLSGQLVPWIERVAAFDGYDVGLGALLGEWWIAAALPLAAWLTWRGHVGWAGLALSPYWIPQYSLMPLLEVVRRDELVAGRELRSEQADHRPDREPAESPPRYADA